MKKAKVLKQSVAPEGKKHGIGHHFKKYGSFYVMLIIPVTYFVVFKYWPMFGLVIAFQDYKVGSAFLSANVEWVGLKWFVQLFNYPFVWRLIRNTLALSIYSLVVGFPLAIILALFLNEILNRRFKRFTTSLSLLPHFLSTTVVIGMLSNFLNVNDGIVNQLIVALGGTAVDFMGTSKYFRTLYVFSGVWQNMGFNAVVYTAAISSVDPQLYEAAFVDGSTRFKNIYLITLPCIWPTIAIMLILRIGDLLSVGYEKVILMYSERIYDVADVLSTYAYRNGILDNKWSYSTAIGLLESVVGLVLVYTANRVSRSVSDNSLW